MKFSENKSSRIKFEFITPCKQATVDSEYDRTVSLRMRMRFSYKLYVLNQNIKVQHGYQIFVLGIRVRGSVKKRSPHLRWSIHGLTLYVIPDYLFRCCNTMSKQQKQKQYINNKEEAKFNSEASSLLQKNPFFETHYNFL